jgi:dUTP pyrophosphatase
VNNRKLITEEDLISNTNAVESLYGTVKSRTMKSSKYQCSNAMLKTEEMAAKKTEELTAKRNEIIEIRFKILDERAKIPEYKTSGAVGMDLSAVVEDGKTVNLGPGFQKIIGTGLAVAIPDGYEMQIRPRSGLSFSKGITITNSPGTIDPDYRGEIKIILRNEGSVPFRVNTGDRIAQAVICPVVRPRIKVVDSLDSTNRGSGGLGSTGK